MDITLSEARQKAQEARKQIEAAHQTLGENVKVALTEGFTAIFAKYPFLGSVAWPQYTPFFNDGDPCIFHSSFTYPSINSVKDIEGDTAYTHGDECGEDFASHSEAQRWLGYDAATRQSKTEPNPNYDPQYGECQETILAFVKELAGPDDRSAYEAPSTFDAALQRVFGDHVCVVVTREGFEIDDYEHE